MVPLRRHWYASGAVPLAATVKVTGRFTCTTRPTGWVVIAGAMAMVRVTLELVAEPTALETVTQ